MKSCKARHPSPKSTISTGVIALRKRRCTRISNYAYYRYALPRNRIALFAADILDFQVRRCCVRLSAPGIVRCGSIRRAYCDSRREEDNYRQQVSADRLTCNVQSELLVGKSLLLSGTHHYTAGPKVHHWQIDVSWIRRSAAIKYNVVAPAPQ